MIKAFKNNPLGFVMMVCLMMLFTSCSVSLSILMLKDALK